MLVSGITEHVQFIFADDDIILTNNATLIATSLDLNSPTLNISCDDSSVLVVKKFLGIDLASIESAETIALLGVFADMNISTRQENHMLHMKGAFKFTKQKILDECEIKKFELGFINHLTGNTGRA